MCIIYDNGNGVRVHGQWEISQRDAIPKRQSMGTRLVQSLHASIGNSASLLMATRFHLTLLTVIGTCVPHCPRSATFLLSLFVIYVMYVEFS
jgi:hypothetical protein